MTATKTSKKTAKSKAKSAETVPVSQEAAIDAQNAPGATVDAPEGTSVTTPDATETPTGSDRKPAKAKEPKPKTERAPKEELVVFAFRLTPAERDAIHKAAGPAKASQVRPGPHPGRLGGRPRPRDPDRRGGEAGAGLVAPLPRHRRPLG